jgi:transcriptional regulator with XRE-family HTH domain
MSQKRWRQFGAALTGWLARSHKTQTAVAKEIGVSTSTISAWKQGQAEPDRPDTTFALERALGAPAGELSRFLGYVPPESAAGSWEAALGLEPGQVDDRMREAIFTVIEAMKKLA